MKLYGERAFGQCDTCFLLIRLQGMLENCAKTSGSQLVAHIKSKEGMRVLEGVLVGYEEMTMREWDVMDRVLGWGKGPSV